MTITNLTSTELRLAADLKEQIAKLETQLEQLKGTKAPVIAKPAKLGGKSAAGRASRSAKMKAYWAARKAGKVKTLPKVVSANKPAKKKFTMSAAAKAKIGAAVKARWAKIKAAKKKK